VRRAGKIVSLNTRLPSNCVVQNQAWNKALKTCADPARATQFLEQLRGTSAKPLLDHAGDEQARVLLALFSGSQFLGELLLAHPDWLPMLLDLEALQFPRPEQGLLREVAGPVASALKAGDYAGALAKLRQLKQREMLRIAARDLAGMGAATDIIREISNVADVCLNSVHHVCGHQLVERLGRPYHQDVNDRWQPTPGCVLGMGKLGGQELNYSSDVDVLFVYAEEGFVFKEPPRKSAVAGRGLSSHQFFKRLAEAFIAEVARLTADGMLYRIDVRLRPEGDAGPLARSLPGYENYYAQWGQTWERMMLIKARCVAGDHSLAGEFLEMVQPFRYPRSLNGRIVGEVAAIKQRIEKEIVKAGELDRNVKLGRGGIREIEFVAQTLQLLNGGKVPFLQGVQTLPALQKLVQYRFLTGADAQILTGAYSFLRKVEHRLQMENNLQTHTIPTELHSRERLARLMGFAALREFQSALQGHTAGVRRIYDSMLKAAEPLPADVLSADFEGRRESWRKLLEAHSFRDPDKAVRLLQEFVSGPGYVHVSPRTTELALQLVPGLLALCPNNPPDPKLQNPSGVRLSDPDRVLARLDSYISAYGSRAMLYEAWTGNPQFFELLLLLFDRSEFLAETVIRTPDLIDDLVQGDRLRRSKTKEEILTDLRHGKEDADQALWMRRYHQAELLRLGLRDILGLADFEQNLVELSALADACLAYALEVVLRRNQLKSPPFAIIGLGKLGGSELTYGSDLDIIFVAEDGARNLAALHKLASELMELLSAKTEQGMIFLTDARLRPDGEKGLLVNTLAAYEAYYRQRALLWEIQSITRARFVVGNTNAGRRFQELAAKLANFRPPSLPLAAYKPDWKVEIARMRQRIEKERTSAGGDALAIKTGSGGLVDAEFIVQTLCLANGWHEPNTLRALERARTEAVLPDADRLLENYRKLRRIEGILRRWSYEGETELPDDPAPMYRVAVRCGFSRAEEFLKAVAGYRQNIRTVYEQVMAK
jgi:glutamate-ammonia-ligase adenylyltransferase